MCGIVGIAAAGLKQPCLVGRLVEGLERLEYRGYDSAGIATVQAHDLVCRKTVGKIDALRKVLAIDLASEAGMASVVLGMGHTRWATHGVVTVANAHPQTDGTVAVVHNGIIENAELLRQELLEALKEDLAKAETEADIPDAVRVWAEAFQGSKNVADLLPLLSQTDTEILVHWVARERRWGFPFAESVHKTLKKVCGTYAVVFLDKTCPDQMIAARKGSPLTIGRGSDERSFFVASDISVLASWASESVDLKEGELVIFQRQLCRDGKDTGFSAHFFTIGAPEREKTPVWIAIQSAVTTVDKGIFPDFTSKEMSEQPAVIQSILDRFDSGAFVPFAQKLEACGALNLIACGSSFYASLVGRYWMESFAGLPTQAEVASEFRYRTPVVGRTSMNVFLSQSGETIDTLKALELVQSLQKGGEGPTCSVITNVPYSLMAKTVVAPVAPSTSSGSALLLEAGPELSVVSTKAFTAQMAILAALVIETEKIRLKTDSSDQAEDLRTVPHLVRQILERADSDRIYETAAELLSSAQTVLYLGRGTSYPIALEGALKLKETAYIPAEGYPAGELKHGPIALVNNRITCVVLAPGDELFTKTLSNTQEIMARGGSVIFVTDERGSEKLKVLEARQDFTILTLPNGGSIAKAFTFAVACQILAYRTAKQKGCDVDRPRNLAKAVTVE